MVYVADHTLAGPRRPSAAALALPRLNLALWIFVGFWRARRELGREQRYAAQFTDRDLWDVGLTRGDIHREFSRRR